MDLSVVIPIYNEEQNIGLLYERLQAVLSTLPQSYEVILVNDGSKDQSARMLDEIYAKDAAHVRVVHFNGNFGQHMAIMAGFEQSIGKTVVTLDADLQNPPEEIPKLLAEIAKGHDIVEGVRQVRKDNAFRRYASRLNNWIRQKTTGIRLQDQGSMLRAYDRRVVELMLMSKERSTFIPALAYSYASNPGFINVDHAERNLGKSKYSLMRLFRLHFDLMAGFSSAPLQFVTLTGMGVSFLSFLFVIYMIIRRIVLGPEAEGLFTLFAIQFFLLGLLLFSVGIVGEYIGRIYLEVRRRPRYVIRKTLSAEEKHDHSI
jgi:undecaprenyl-phosphate 4-deoxy-4-formamido-L-arabinose transferase